MTGSLRAVETLSRVDPDFARLCDVLYGGEVDAQSVWEDVFAKGYVELDDEARADAVRGYLVPVSKEMDDKKKRQLTAGASAVGAAAGLIGTAAGVSAIRRGMGPKNAGTLVRLKRGLKHTTKIERGLLAVEPVGLAGEVSATHILHGDTKKKQPGAVVKMEMPKPVVRMAHGILHFRGSKAPHIPPAAGAAGADSAKMQAKRESYRKTGNGVANLVNTPKRVAATLATTGAAGGGVFMAGQASGQKKATAAASQDPMAKRAPDMVWSGEFSKFDDDKRLAFGWASVVEKDGLPVIDRQGDYISPDEMETAAYVYVQKSRVGGEMHKRDDEDRAVHVSDLVESVVFTKEKIAKMGLPASTPIGWWVGFKIHNEDTWQTVKKGGHTGFSIHGRGRRQETSMDDVMKDHR